MNDRSTRARHACAVLLVLWASAPDAAGTATAQSESLTLARAIELAATHGPAVAAMTAEAESLASSTEADALPPNFVIETDFENFAGTGNASGTDVLESTLRLSRVIEL